MKQKKMSLLSIGAYAVICIIWGSSNLVIKIGTDGLPPFVFAALRFLIAAACGLPFALTGAGKFPRAKWEYLHILIRAVLLNVLCGGLLIIAMQYIDSGIATLLLSLVPIFVTLFDCFILRNHRLGIMGGIGLLGGFGGIALVILTGQANFSASLTGTALMLFASLAWSCGSVFSRRQLSGSPFAHLSLQTGCASAIFAILALCTGQFQGLHFSLPVLFPVFYLGIFDSFVGLTAYIYLLRIWKPTRVSTYAYVNTVVAFILGAAVLGEAVTTLRIAAVAVILISVLLIQMDRTPKSNRREYVGEQLSVGE